jgi:hypothetical protein
MGAIVGAYPGTAAIPRYLLYLTASFVLLTLLLWRAGVIEAAGAAEKIIEAERFYQPVPGMPFVFRDQEPVGLPTFPYAGPVERAVVEEMARQETLEWETVNLDAVCAKLKMTEPQIVQEVAAEQHLARSRTAVQP